MNQPNIQNLKVDPSLLDGLFTSPLGILIVVIIALILLFVLWIVFKKISMRHKINKEKHSLKQDLMIWSNLSKLVSGGKKTKNEKEELAVNIKLISQIFDSAITNIKAKCFKKNKTPWYVVLGEPLAGKSTILKAPDLSCDLSRREMDVKDEECAHFYINNKQVFLDVKGKTFLDSWLGSSSAQWNLICELIKKYHHVKPLSGIVLVIPADALIADDPKLTIKKANMMAQEITRMCSVLCMSLPCRIVISKCDTITGFRELCASLGEKQREQAVGFDLTNDEECYFEDLFESEFDKFIERITSATFNNLSTNEVLNASFEGNGRIDKSANLVSLPHHLSLLKERLAVYLSIIFAKTLSFKPALIEGVYFTSSIDQGINLDNEFAAVKGQSIDEALIVEHNETSYVANFAHDLFTKYLPSLDFRARFTKREKTKRMVPMMVCYTLLVCICLNYLAGTVLGNRLIYTPLRAQQIYLQNLGSSFANDKVQNSPLLGLDEDGKGALYFNTYMYRDVHTIRSNFYNLARTNLLSEISLPNIYLPSNYLFYDFNNLGIDKRKSLYNQLLVNMVFVPATSSFSEDLLESQSLFTGNKADALFSFMNLALAKDSTDYNPQDLVKDCLLKIIAYLYPGITPRIIDQITDLQKGDDAYMKAAINKVVIDKNYDVSVENGIKEYIKQMNMIEAYPESSYQEARLALKSGVRLTEIYNELKDYSFGFNPKSTVDNYLDKFVHLTALIKEALMISKRLDKDALPFIKEFSEVAKVVKKDDKKAPLIDVQRKAILRAAYEKYRSDTLDDFEQIEKFVYASNAIGSHRFRSTVVLADIDLIKEKTLASLENDFDQISKDLMTVHDSKIFDILVNKSNQETITYRQLAGLVNIASLVDEDAKLTINIPSDYENGYKSIAADMVTFKNEIKSLTSNVSDNHWLEPVAHSLNDYLLLSEYASKVYLTRRLLELYPQDKNQGINLMMLIDKISEFDKNNDLLSSLVNEDLARDALGYFEVSTEYSPMAVDNYINPIGFVASIKNEFSKKKADDKIKASDAAFVAFLQNDKNVNNALNIMGSYAGKFVLYWSNFGDELKPYANDYYSFHDFALSSKAYQINSQLRDVYNFSYEILSLINPNSLTNRGKNTIDDAKKLIDARRKVLGINFTAACNNVLNAWAILPDNAIAANAYIRSLSKKTIRNDYTLVRNLSDSKANIPWWTSFVNLGTALLKSEASHQTVVSLDSFQQKLYYFPILKDATYEAMSLKVRDLSLLKNKLKSFGFKKKEKLPEDISAVATNLEEKVEETAQDDGVNNMQEPLIAGTMDENSDVNTWASNVLEIMDTIGDMKNPLKVKISIPNLEKQNELIGETNTGLTNSALLYRYADVSVDGRATPRRSTVVEKEESVLYNGLADKGNLVINYYMYSNAEKADTTYKLKGSYSALRLYLDKNAIVSEKDKCTYAPVYLKDSKGNESMMYLKLEFNKELLDPNEWPSSENWPSINVF